MNTLRSRLGRLEDYKIGAGKLAVLRAGRLDDGVDEALLTQGLDPADTRNLVVILRTLGVAQVALPQVLYVQDLT